MGSSDLDIDVRVLAEWIGRQAGERLWTVDGEARVAGAVRLPCPGHELAALLSSLGGRLRVFAPQGARAEASGDLSKLAEKDEGGLSFEVAWLADDSAGQHWVLAEDTLAEEAEQAARQA